MEVGNSHFTAIIDLFAWNTYIMVIVSSDQVPTGLTKFNIRAAIPHFERIMANDRPELP